MAIRTSNMKPMNATKVREILLDKYCSTLEDPNKRQRKLALENIHKELNLLDGNELVDTFKTIQKYLIRCIHDESEACREYVVSLIAEFVNKMPKDENFLVYLMPELRGRLGGKDFREPSEEVRLLIICLLRTIVAKYEKSVAPYLDDYIEILKRTIVDPYPSVKKESCECAADLGKAIPMNFHYQSESLIKPMLQAMCHQHHRIRISVIKSLGDVILYGNNISVSDAAGPLAERLFDQNAMVRLTVARVVGMWLLKLRDRYSFFYKLIPLMLTSLLDEIHEQGEEAWSIWDEAGKQWAKENENDIKDKIDFLPDEISWYPNGVRRPNIGCRELVQREMSKFIPGIISELTNWKVDIRVKSAQLLCATLQHAESKITLNLAKLIPPMFKAFCDEDPRVVVNVKRSAELIGYFVPPEIYCAQILPAMEEITTTGNLGVLAAAVEYSPPESVIPKLEEIVDIVNKDDCCYSIRASEQEQIINLITYLLENCGEYCTNNVTVRQKLFSILVSVHALTKNEVVCNQITELLEMLELGGKSKDTVKEGTLVKECMPKLFERLQASMNQWTVHSPQLPVFELLFEEYYVGVAASLDVVLPLLKDAMEETMDAEVVLRILWTIFNALKNNKFLTLIENKERFFDIIFTEILVKRLVWKAGRSAEALRTAAAACLYDGLHKMGEFISLRIDREHFDLLVPLVLSLVEDTSEKTRIFAFGALIKIIIGSKNTHCMTIDDVDKFIIVAMKRLDDVSNAVRIKAVDVITAIYTEPDPMRCYNGTKDSLYSTLLVHLDDPDLSVQMYFMEALRTVGQVDPKGLLKKISLDTFRDKKIGKDISDFLKELIEVRTQAGLREFC